MATPEERKAKLQASRLQKRPNLGLRRINEFKSVQQPPDFNSANSLHTSRASALASNRFQQGLANTPPPLSSQLGAQRKESSTTLNRNDDDTNQQTEQNRRTDVLRNTIAQRSAKQQEQEQQKEQANEQTTKGREEIKKTAKAAMRRGFIYVVNLLAGTLDMSSAGISFVVDILIYFFTFSWLNLEMIYGKYLAKGKSKFISPLSWAPIPMPIDKDALILCGFVVAADITLVLAFAILMFGGFCIVNDLVIVTGSITEAAQIGAGLAQGESGGLCLGGIMESVFGL